MERNFKRVSQALKLPRESRERIRSQIASYQAEQEEIPMKKANLKRRLPLIAVAAVMATALTLTAAAVVTRQFRNEIIVSSREEIFTHIDKEGDDAPAAYGVVSPGSAPASSLEEITEGRRFKTDDWPVGERINGGAGAEGYTMWDSVEVLSSDPTLRSRRVGRADGAEKMEYTAENPVNLLPTLTGRVTLDLTWMNDNYKYIPDANMSFVVADKKGNYVSELFDALYAKPDESGYIQVGFYNRAQERRDDPTYIIDGSYETAYYYTTPGGYEFTIKLDKGRVWADCDMSHAHISLFGAYLTGDEVEDILDNLSLSVTEQP